jgi:predicted ArsR family transcriptional regulator
MKLQKLNKRFFESTRGRIVTLLRRSDCTVNELAEELKLTDNAVRAHLLTLERDGLVRQSGLRRGSRKPHFAYQLTDDADHLFPKAYDALLNQFIAVLKAKLAPKAFKEALHAVGRSLANQNQVDATEGLKRRVQNAVNTLESLGGNPTAEKQGGKLVIRSTSCPLAAVVSEHPETCQMVETLLSELTGAQAIEQCNRGSTPRCSFTINQRTKA